MQALKSFLKASLLSLILCVAVLEVGTGLILTHYRDSFLFYDVDELLTVGAERSGKDCTYDRELGWLRNTPDGIRSGKHDHLPLAAAAYGDSFILGGEVEDHETWEEALAALSGRGILNYGQSAYSTDQTLLHYRRVAPKIKAPVSIIGITSANINTNINVYRKFYYAKTGMALTKPRFELMDDKLTLIENPVQTQEGLRQLANPQFVLSMGQHDGWFNRKNLPVLTFPYIQVYFHPNFWRQIQYGRINKEINDVNPIPWENLWTDEGSTKLTLALLNENMQAAKAVQSIPVLLHLPTKTEISAFMESGVVPDSVTVLEKTCKEKAWRCLFPLRDMSHIFTSKPFDAWFQPGGHYSPKGNEAIAKWLYEKFKADAATARYF